MPLPRVLVVDDDPNDRRLYRAHLLQAGYEVAEAASGIEAVETAEREPFALIVMDLSMPGLDGWMAISLLKARCPSTPVVILTNSTGGDVEKQALHVGAAAFLSKPCPPEQFTRTVAKVIGRA